MVTYAQLYQYWCISKWKKKGSKWSKTHIPHCSTPWQKVSETILSQYYDSTCLASIFIRPSVFISPTAASTQSASFFFFHELLCDTREHKHSQSLGEGKRSRPCCQSSEFDLTTCRADDARWQSWTCSMNRIQIRVKPNWIQSLFFSWFFFSLVCLLFCSLASIWLTWRIQMQKHCPQKPAHVKVAVKAAYCRTLRTVRRSVDSFW